MQLQGKGVNLNRSNYLSITLTGESSGCIIIWNVLPLLNATKETDSAVPKMLCQMDNHFACVNCVRWSQNGTFLASAGDDKLIMIWR